MFTSDVLIPVKHLINGVTIEQIPVQEVAYYHVDLPHHAVLLAAPRWLSPVHSLTRCGIG